VAIQDGRSVVSLHFDDFGIQITPLKTSLFAGIPKMWPREAIEAINPRATPSPFHWKHRAVQGTEALEVPGMI
jgi:hypothetical protein